MNCPAEVAAILTEILRRGLLRIREAGWSGDAARCALEADHLHNLPALLSDYSPDRFAYYLDCERPSYLSAGGVSLGFEPLWDRLRQLREGSVTGEAVPVTTR